MNVIDYESRHGTIRNKKTLKSEAHRVVRMLIITLSIMILALSVIFLVSTNESAQKGYMLEQLKLKNEQLRNNESELETKITNSTAFINMEDAAGVKKMQKTEVKNYVTTEDNKVK